MRRTRTWLAARRWQIAALLVVAGFAILAGRFWHPYYGFTRFLQLDEADARIAVPGLQASAVYAYPGPNGYDGTYYVQIAFHPLLDSPHLRQAFAHLPYRARRILASALAWVLAGGAPGRIAHVYAALNLLVWAGLAWLLWRLLAVRDARSWVAWAGVMLSAGTLHSVRLALTDLLAATLLAGAMRAAERPWPRLATGLLALGGLARETVLAGCVGLWRGPWRSGAAWMHNARRTVIVALPLALWIAYIRWRVGPGDAGFGNLTLPLAGWLGKWGEVWAGYERHPGFAWLNTTTLLATLAVTAQGAFVLRRPQPDDRWWRVGAVAVALLLLLGTAVWAGHPGAFTRVLLPLGLAFAVLTVRRQAGWGWLVAGNLSVCSGLLALWHVPIDPHELAAGRTDGIAYVVRTAEGWHGSERHEDETWAWSEGDAELEVLTAPRDAGPLNVRLGLRALGPRRVEIRRDGTVYWSGDVGVDFQRIGFVLDSPGRLEVRSDAPPIAEGNHPGARDLDVALYDPRLESLARN